MTSEMRKKSPEIIEDLFTQNYTIVSLNQNWSINFLESLIPESQRPKIMKLSEKLFFEFFIKFIDDDSAKFAFFTDESPKLRGIQLKETLLSDRDGIRMGRNHALFWLSEDLLQFLTAGGIPQRIYNFYNEIFYPPKEKEILEPKVMTIDDLSYGFVIWIIASGFTVFIFVFEFLDKFLITKILNWIKLKFCGILINFFFFKILENFIRSKNSI